MCLDSLNPVHHSCAKENIGQTVQVHGSKRVDPSLCAYRTNVAKKIQRCAERDAVYFPTKKTKDSARDQLFNGVLISSQDFALEGEECKWFNTHEVRLTVLMCSTTESLSNMRRVLKDSGGHADDKRSSGGGTAARNFHSPIRLLLPTLYLGVCEEDCCRE